MRKTGAQCTAGRHLRMRLPTGEQTGALSCLLPARRSFGTRPQRAHEASELIFGRARGVRQVEIEERSHRRALLVQELRWGGGGWTGR